MEKSTEFNLGTVFSKSFEFICKNFFSFLILFLINISLSILIFQIFIKKVIIIINEKKLTSYSMLSKIFNQDITIFLLCLIPISLIINLFLASMIRDYNLKLNLSIKEKLKYALKNIWVYIGGNLILCASIFGLVLLWSITLIIPIINIISLFVGIVLFVIYMGYFIYVPYTAFLNHSCTDLFEKTKKYMRGHLGGSIVIIVIYGIIDRIINELFAYSLQSNIQSHNILKLLFVMDIIGLIYNVLVITYITLAYKDYKYKVTYSYTSDTNQDNSNQIFFDN